jgi:hypothetical protein
MPPPEGLTPRVPASPRPPPRGAERSRRPVQEVAELDELVALPQATVRGLLAADHLAEELLEVVERTRDAKSEQGPDDQRQRHEQPDREEEDRDDVRRDPLEEDRPLDLEVGRELGERAHEEEELEQEREQRDREEREDQPELESRQDELDASLIAGHGGTSRGRGDSTLDRPPEPPT